MAVFTYTNATGMTLPPSGSSGLASQSLNFYGQVGAVTNVSVSLDNVSHTWPDDLDMLLVGPNGVNNLLFMSDAGGGTDLVGVDLTFSDAGASTLVDNGIINPGTWLATDHEVGESDATFGTATGGINSGSTTSFATAFGGISGNGAWSLYVNDDTAIDTGSLGGWSVSVTTASDQANLIGTGGDDQFTLASSVAGTGQFGVNSADPVGYSGVTSWLIDGGGGVDILYFFSDGANTYSFDLTTSDLTSIETLSLFDPGAGGSATVTLNASEIGDGFAANGTVGGAFDSTVADTLAIVMGADTAVDLSALTFLNFFQPLDRVTITGDGDDETITGSAMRDLINAGDGADTINGGDGNDTIIAGQSSLSDSVDTVFGGAGDDDITGGFYVDILNGDAGNDTFFFSGDDFFDIVDGGADSDTLNFSGSAFSGITVNLDAGTYSNQYQTAELTFSSIERVTGSAQADTIIASGVVSVEGSFGNDTVIVTDAAANGFFFGGVGDDTLDISSDNFAGQIYNLSASSFSINGALFSQFENVIDNDGGNTLTGSSVANVLRGNGGIDTISGNGGDDTIEGGAGGDVLDGGANDANGDTLSYAASAAGVTVNLGTNGASGGDADFDTISNFENLIGSAQADNLTGSASDNWLNGGAGADVLNGGGGGDTADYRNHPGSVGAVVYLLAPNLNGGDAAGDTYVSIENVAGTANNDRIYADNNANVVFGIGGAYDTAELYAGADSYFGGEGYDYVLAGAGGDTISVNGGSSLVYGEGDADTISAASGTNELYGGAGGDTITGGSDQDVIFGGIDSDTLNGGESGDFIFGEDGVDTIHGDGGDDLIQGNAEGDDLYGDAGVDVILGGTGGDFIDGGTDGDFLFGEAGIDTINGGDGDEQIYGGSENDFLYGAAGFDIIFGGDGDDFVDGGAGFDIGGNVNFLFGDAGNDTIVSSAGQDQMWGGDGVTGTGNDTFYIGGTSGYDIIFDFEAGAGIVDTINLAGSVVSSFVQLQGEGRLVQEGANTHILLGAGNDLFLMNVTATNLVADDFAFV